MALKQSTIRVLYAQLTVVVVVQAIGFTNECFETPLFSCPTSNRFSLSACTAKIFSSNLFARNARFLPFVRNCDRTFLQTPNVCSIFYRMIQYEMAPADKVDLVSLKQKGYVNFVRKAILRGRNERQMLSKT